MSTLTEAQANAINNLDPGSQVFQVGTRLKNSLDGDLPDGSIKLSEIATPLQIAVLLNAKKTTSRDENIAGLSSALTLGEALRVTMDAHAADAAEHTTAADATNFPLTSPASTDLTTLIVLITEILTAYPAHDTDAKLGIGWAFHAAQYAGSDLASTAAPTTLNECVTRLNDIKAKYNVHDANATAHAVGTQHAEAETDAALGDSILVTALSVLSGDTIIWGILNNGTGNVTGDLATAGAGAITFKFSADPQDDSIINYAVFRAAG